MNIKSNQNPENALQQSETLGPLESSDDGLSQNLNVSGHVSEFAREIVLSPGSSSQQSSSQNEDQDAHLSVRNADPVLETEAQEYLRAKLLSQVPDSTTMRHEIESALLKSESKINAEINTGQKSQDYALQSDLIAKLRLIHKTLHSLARRTYEALQDLWLYWVHGLA